MYWILSLFVGHSDLPTDLITCVVTPIISYFYLLVTVTCQLIPSRVCFRVHVLYRISICKSQWLANRSHHVCVVTPIVSCSLAAVGSPIHLPHIKDPSPEEIKFWHSHYLQKLSELFDEHKQKYNVSPDTKLEFIWFHRIETSVLELLAFPIRQTLSSTNLMYRSIFLMFVAMFDSHLFVCFLTTIIRARFLVFSPLIWPH